jgi:excisionase family DNA binding protein
MPQVPPLSATEASSQTGIPKRTILWAIRQGHLKAHKLSGPTGAYLIAQRELDKYVLGHQRHLDERIAKRQRELDQRKRGLEEYIAKRDQERAS